MYSWLGARGTLRPPVRCQGCLRQQAIGDIPPVIGRAWEGETCQVHWPVRSGWFLTDGDDGANVQDSVKTDGTCMMEQGGGWVAL